MTKAEIEARIVVVACDYVRTMHRLMELANAEGKHRAQSTDYKQRLAICSDRAAVESRATSLELSLAELVEELEVTS